jgi:Ser/Thr protein kinase RdoA (MazF antagonist)
MSLSTWGSEETQTFFSLTPERILDAVEASGLRCTGRCLTLNSMENRVYEVELELDPDVELRSPSERFRIAKFYRPGRWTQEQILQEHQFLQDLREEEIPVVAPIPFEDGRTLHQLDDTNIWYTVFPKVGGRSPDELNDEQLARIGRLLARMHNVGAVKQAPDRVRIHPDTYGRQSLAYLLESKTLPWNIEEQYKDIVEHICDLCTPWFEQAEVQRVHGDCHLGNLLWGPEGPFWVDFDDMVQGPCVQDIWLVTPGRDEWATRQRNILLDAYEMMRPFDYSTLRLVEPLRALRMIHFHAWISKRWKDPAFPHAFPQFGTDKYWQEELHALAEQRQLIQARAQSYS